ncbi:MAG TPA: ECF transporter S component, partial [Candidatus Dormibacteraeota bacterium]|nr:ECF transporter S component [Candidatus Dormibacteraeota bacterium]
AVGLGAVAALTAVEVGARRLDSRRLALLATIAAIDAALRMVVVIGVAGFSPLFFLVLCAGYAVGPQFGFLAGALSLLASALVTGGVGPWVPYEMFGVAWMGTAAGLCGLGRRGTPGRRDLAVLAVAGAALGWLYGALLDIWDWTQYRGDPGFGWAPGMAPATALRHYASYYATTSFVWDTFRAAGDVLAVVLLGAPVLLALRRFRQRFTVTVLPLPDQCPEPAINSS